MPDEGDRDLFVHQTNICQEGFRHLVPGQRVEYTRAEGAKGPKALWVVPLDAGPAPPPMKEPEPANSNQVSTAAMLDLARWFGES